MLSDNTPAVKDLPPLPSIYTGDDQDKLDANDLIIRKVYLLQDRSEQVKTKNAEPGDVILAADKTDTGFDFLVGGGRTSFTGFILDRQRTVIRSEPGGGDFEFLPSNYERQADERDVWVGWNYLIAIPEIDPVLPAKLLLIKTAGRLAFQKVNTALQKAKAMGATDPVAIEFTVVTRTGKVSKADFFALNPAEVSDPDPQHLEIAKQMMQAGARLERYEDDSAAPTETSDL